MPSPSALRTHSRFALATLVVVGLYIALDVLLLEINAQGIAAGFKLPGVDAAIERDARAVADASTAREAALTPQHRVAAWRLGRNLGYASQLAGALALNATSEVDNARRVLAEVMREAEVDARALGVGPVAPLTGSTLAASGSLRERIEADETGLAAQVEARTTRRHRHLLLSGMHVGAHIYSRVVVPELASVPNAAEIERHARLAGLDATLWRPLAQPRGDTPAERRDAYIAAARAVDRALLNPQEGAGLLRPPNAP